MENGPRPGPENAQKTKKNGVRAFAKRILYTLGPSDETSDHEAAHVVLSRRIKSATRIRRGNALGTTEPEELTAPAAAAAAADGHGGYSWDKFITERHLGVPFGQAIAAARAGLAGLRVEKKAIAAAIHRKGTIYQADVDEAYKLADKVKKGVATVIVYFWDRNGKKSEFTRETTQSTDQVLSEVVGKEEKSENESAQQNKEHIVYSWTDRDQKLLEDFSDKFREGAGKQKELVEV